MLKKILKMLKNILKIVKHILKIWKKNESFEKYFENLGFQKKKNLENMLKILKNSYMIV